MSERVFNFSAGPSALPLPVIERAQAELTQFQDTGVSILELGHRTKTFQAVTRQATDRIRQILQVPDDYDVFFVQGGGRLIFSILPMNFCLDGKRGKYLVTGSWGKAAYAEAEKAGSGDCVYDGAATGYSSLPDLSSLEIPPQSAYVHYTSNETIEGVQFPCELKSATGITVPVIADMSSDFMSRPVDIRQFDMIYACIQKNLGPAGATVVIAKRDWLNQAPENLPGYLRLANHAAAESMYNTPPVFCIYVANLVLEWFLQTFGDLESVGQFHRQMAESIYQVLEAHPQLYQLHAEPDCRSLMNVTFRLPSQTVQDRFLDQARQQGLAYLAGHRSVGGIRASLYNAMTREGADALARFLTGFAAKSTSLMSDSTESP